jgi:hypothetical protein
MKDISVFPALIVGCVAFSAAPAFGQTRNPTTWPFSGTSPWNTPIGSGATFAPISASVWNKLNSNGTAYYQLALNWQANTTSVIIAGTKDPTWTIYDNQNLTFPPSGGETLIPLSTEYNNSVWYSLHAPTAPDASGAQTWCEPVTDDDTSTFISDSMSPTAASLQANYPNNMPFPYNPWTAPESVATGFNNIGAAYAQTLQMPTGVCGSPDSDGWASVMQPAQSHYAVDFYAPVVIPKGKNKGAGINVVIGHAITSFYDLEGDGTGVENGRRATMIPTTAGLIRAGELSNGLIPHALAAVMGPDMLTIAGNAAWPAWGYDQQDGGLYYNCTGCLQIGALLVIPSSINLNNYTWTTYGRIVAQAAQTYGIYITDTGSTGEMNLLAELNDPDLNGANGSNLLPGANGWSDLQQIRSLLVQVTNNTPSTVGGGGNPPANWSPPPPFAY